jgi:hypothetical protein
MFSAATLVTKRKVSPFDFVAQGQCIEYLPTNIVIFFNSVDLSTNTTLRSITIDSLTLNGFEVDPCFLPLLSMLFRINSSCLDTISLTVTLDTYHINITKAPWTQLAQSVIAHLNSLRSLNIILRGISLSPRYLTYARELRLRDRLKEKIEQEISGIRLGEKTLLAITNISFAWGCYKV